LLEINLSPSLACESPLDFQIKSTLIQDTFNLIGLKKFDRRKESMNKVKHRMKGFYRGKSLNHRSTTNNLNSFKNSTSFGNHQYNGGENNNNARTLFQTG
jgi:hypothetical protein